MLKCVISSKRNFYFVKAWYTIVFYFDYYLETAILTNIIISESYLKTHDVLYFDWLIDRILFRIPIENIFSHVGTSAFRWRAVILCFFPALTVFYPEGIFYHVITRNLGLYDLFQGTTTPRIPKEHHVTRTLLTLWGIVTW